MADGDEEKYIREVIPWVNRDVFGRRIVTVPGSSSLKILHSLEFSRLEGACSHARYYFLG